MWSVEDADVTFGGSMESRVLASIEIFSHFEAVQVERLEKLDGHTTDTRMNICPMPALDLTDLELATAAQACRAMAFQDGERAKKIDNPSLRGPMEDTAKRYATLAERFEVARRRKANGR